MLETVMSSTHPSCSCSRTIISTTRSSIIIPNNIGFYSVPFRRGTRVPIGGGVRASTVDSSESSSSNFAKRIETAWLISQQPRPVACTSCHSNGHVECKWCGGTGFFILGDNMLCQVPSQNTSCIICTGKGSTSCADCKGTGFRAKWLDEPPVSKQ